VCSVVKATATIMGMGSLSWLKPVATRDACDHFVHSYYKV
jgi:hypothetical protein